MSSLSCLLSLEKSSTGAWGGVNCNYMNPPPRLCGDHVIKQAMCLPLGSVDFDEEVCF